MIRVAGPSLIRLEQFGDAYARDVIATLETALRGLGHQLHDPPTLDDISQFRTRWSAYVMHVLLPKLTTSYWYGVNVVHERIVHELARTASVSVDVPVNAIVVTGGYDVINDGPELASDLPPIAEAVPRVTNQRAQSRLADAGNRLVGIGDNAWNYARDEMVTGLQLGEGIGTLAERLMSVLSVAQPRAEMIARTEVNGAANLGALDQMKETGLRATKEWIATSDNRTRPAHKLADGQVVGLNEMFTVGGVPIDGPHDVGAPPGETINCRCTIAFYITEDDLQVFADSAVSVDLIADAGYLQKFYSGQPRDRKGRFDEGHKGSESGDEGVKKGEDAYAAVPAMATSSAHYYVNNGMVVNSTLRYQTRDLSNKDDEVVAQIHQLDRDIEAGGGTKEPIEVYRGMVGASYIFGPMGENVGATFKDLGYTSTATDRAVPNMFTHGVDTAFITIKAPTGTKAITVGNLDQSEVILARSSEYRITRDEIVNERREIDLKLVSQR